MRLYRNVKLLALLALMMSFMIFILLFDKGSNDGISGNVVYTHAEILPVQFSNCSFTLYPGWNMVSFYCLGLYNQRHTALQSIEGSYGAIFTYVANDWNDPWKSYNSSLPNWTVQQLNYINRLSGYWIYMRNSSNFSYYGVYADSTIPLYEGWNLVGYPKTNPENITVAFDEISFTIAKNYRKILDNMSVYDNLTNTTYTFTYYTGSDEWLVHINGSPSNNLTRLETYKGYWLNVSGDQTWHISR